MPIETHDPSFPTQSARQQRRQRSESYSHTAQQSPPMEGYLYEEEEDDDIDLPLEYTDQSYLGEESETFTCTESYFHDLYGDLEGDGEIPGDYVVRGGSHVTPNRHHRSGRRGEVGHRRSRSATFPGHLEPHNHHSVSKKRPSSPHTAYYSSGHNRSPPQKRRKRPASSGAVSDIPFLHPPSLQPVYPIPQNQVYVFSELQPDGSMQYYSATPINSPPIVSPPPPPPRFNAPSPLQQAVPNPNNSAPPTATTQLQAPSITATLSPRSTQATPQQQQPFSLSAMNNMIPSPHKNVRVEDDGGTLGATKQAPLHLDQAKFSHKVPMAMTESGYFSSAQQGLAMGQSGTSGVPHVSGQQGGIPHNNNIMTNVSPQEIQFSTHLSPNPNLQNDESHVHHHHDGGGQHLVLESPRSGRRSGSPHPQVSPTAKLLESSLQAANVSSCSVSPTAKSPRGTKSSKSSRLNVSLDSRTTTQGLAGMAALYEQKEKVLKARIKALEDSTVELCTENASLKQLCEALKQDASKSDFTC